MKKVFLQIIRNFIEKTAKPMNNMQINPILILTKIFFNEKHLQMLKNWITKHLDTGNKQNHIVSLKKNRRLRNNN